MSELAVFVLLVTSSIKASRSSLRLSKIVFLLNSGTRRSSRRMTAMLTLILLLAASYGATGGRNSIFDLDPGPDPDPSPPPPTSPPSTPSIFDADPDPEMDPSPPPSPSPPSAPQPVTLAPKNCKTDPLQLIVCSPLINHGPLWPLNVPCCGLMGLFGLEVRACLCIAMKANIMGWCNVDMPINLNVLMSFCQFTIEPAFQC